MLKLDGAHEPDSLLLVIVHKGALNQNPYECRQMYLMLTENGKRPSGDIDRFGPETTDEDPPFPDSVLDDEGE